MQKFVIIDGSSLLFRAFFAMPNLTDSNGNPTGAIVGFDNMLYKLLSDYQIDLLAIAFDTSRHTFRTDKYPQYKGTRSETPQELKSQIPLLKEFAKVRGITFLEKQNYEADDIIGTLATKAASQGYDVLVVTGDRDALQLIRPNLKVCLTRKGMSDIKVYDEDVFFDEYGFEPLRLIDLKGLMGDSSDNIPGVPGIGIKTATKLLLEYDSLENVLASSSKVNAKKIRENLLNYKEQALLSKNLATIELNVPDLEFDASSYEIKPDIDKMREFCNRFELRNVWANLKKTTGISDKAAQTEPLNLNFSVISESCDLASLIISNEISLAAVFLGEVPFVEISALALACNDNLAWIEKDTPAYTELFDMLTSDKKVTLWGLKKYYQAGFTPSTHFLDLELADYLITPENSLHTLKSLVERYLPSEDTNIKFKDKREEVVWQAKMLSILSPLLTNELNLNELSQLYQNIELPLVEVLASMEKIGVYINNENLQNKTKEIGVLINKLEEEIYTLAGKEFKINSPKQLGEVLFQDLSLPPVKKTKTGYSTNAEVLEKLRLEHPIIEYILSYRQYAKLKSTYLDGIKCLINADSKRVHTTFNQSVTATGRLSSSEPNLQNIPIRSEEGRTIRALFEPAQGYDYFLSADYSQIELRLLAHLSGDENLLKSFAINEDIHARTASEVFDVPLEEVTSDLRQRAKAINFGIIYGMSDYGLSQDLHIERKEAATYIKNYFVRYPKVKAFLDNTIDKARDTGYVQTICGRKRKLPNLKSANFNQRSLAERMAMNTPIQGSAADIIKLAMIATYHKLKESHLKSRILLQVHDELVLEVPKNELNEVISLLHQFMEEVYPLKVPLLIDIHYGKNWAEAK